MIARKKGRLYIDGVSVESLAKRFGTPLYAYSKQEIERRYDDVKAAFSPLDARVFYAMKANSNGTICRLLARRGAGADIVSAGELLRALSAGFSPKDIVFSGVGKTRAEMELALRRGVAVFNVESAEELEALEQAARRLGKRAPVSIRLNPDVDAKTHPHITTGRAENKFGVEREEALRLCLRAARSRHARLVGVQCHIGSQILSPSPYGLAARQLAALMDDLAIAGVVVEHVDVGGGFGIDYRTGRTLDLSAAAAAVGRGLGRWKGRVAVWVEPGRSLVAEAGALITQVLYRKTTSKRRFVIVDAAMNDLARPSLYDAYHPVEPARRRPGAKTLADVVGPVCETGDFLARRRPLEPVERGDILAVLRAGAYGFSMSSQYNSRPRAAEVLVDGARASVVRARETYKDLAGREA